MSAKASKARTSSPAGPASAAPTPARYRATEKDLFRIEVTENDEETKHWISPSIAIDARTHDSQGDGYGHLVRFHNQDGLERTCIILYSELVCDGKEAIQRLFNMGFRASEKRKDLEALRHYILCANPTTTICSTPSHGWHEKTFIDNDKFSLTEKPSTDIMILDPAVALGQRYNTAGSLEDWKSTVGRLSQGNTRLMLAVSAAFAGPLLHLLKAPNIGLHLRGISSIGKTTALYAAGSVWGGGGEDNNLGFVQSWRTTANGLELQCALHNDAILCLDEISLVNEKEVGDIVYCLGNGIGKRRATRDIKSRPVIQFRLVFLSCGERSLQEIMQGAGKQVRGGQESRLIDIPADPGHNRGLFEVLHEHPDGASLSNALAQAAKHFYGTPSRVWTRYLMDNFDEAINYAKQYRQIFVKKLQLEEHEAAGEVYRIADAFGLIAAAGKMVTMLGILDWGKEDATAAAQTCFDAWRSTRGGSYKAHDVHAGLQAVASFLFRHASRFENLEPGENEHTYPIHNRAGFFEEDQANDCRRYYVNREVFRDEITQGYDPFLILKELQIHKHLVANEGEKRLTFQKRIPSEGTDRFYCILSTVCEKVE